MKLDKFVEDFFENLVDKEGLENIKVTIKSQMNANSKDYDEALVECQIYTPENNFDTRTEISSEGYSDGEIVFIDFHLDKEL